MRRMRKGDQGRTAGNLLERCPVKAYSPTVQSRRTWKIPPAAPKRFSGEVAGHPWNLFCSFLFFSALFLPLFSLSSSSSSSSLLSFLSHRLPFNPSRLFFSLFSSLYPLYPLFPPSSLSPSPSFSPRYSIPSDPIKCH